MFVRGTHYATAARVRWNTLIDIENSLEFEMVLNMPNNGSQTDHGAQGENLETTEKIINGKPRELIFGNRFILVRYSCKA